MTQVVEGLHSKCEASSSNSSTAKKKKKDDKIKGNQRQFLKNLISLF
jgi:hypothetical protein